MPEKYNDEGREIRSDAKPINELLDKKYTLDYYQREYRWQQNQVTDLIDDLTNKFFNNYQAEDQRDQVENYDHYFLGSIIISSQNLLARSLDESAYEHNPGFRQFCERSKLPFQVHSEFNKIDLDKRQKLYQLLAEQIWSPERLFKDAL